MNLDTKSCNVLLFKLAGQMALDEGCLLHHVSQRLREMIVAEALSLSKQWFLTTAQRFGL